MPNFNTDVIAQPDPNAIAEGPATSLESELDPVDALDIIDAAELEQMTPEQQAEFHRQMDASKHAYVNKTMATVFGDVKKSAEFLDAISALVLNHRVEVDGRPSIPKLNDVLYNLSVYSACALDRLSFGRNYRTDWVDPATFTPVIGCEYMVMLSCGLILEATVDTMDTDNLQLVLSDSTTRIHKNRLLAINTYVTDATEFLAGVPRIAFDILPRVEAATVPAGDTPRIKTQRSEQATAIKHNSNRNREKRLRKKQR